ncbi:uracil-DNA glycosylase [Sphingomonas endolithica]|uniref:uracil-DNA glycosylase n=1 Tax=Sphingomonas endolithica TaxID=2972485 RepID=UPI0021AEE83A|nr:uracil-DNA glycosylase [Sphingomonas sp. ZFBP2030]
MLSGLDESWRGKLAPALQGPHMAALADFLAAEDAAGKQVFPASHDRFRALALTPIDRVRVVILGQDPYHGEGQAHGLSFSVPPGVRPPPSLVNIYKELEADLGVPRARHGFLEHWAAQGVLLLNTVLTVEQGRAASHRGRGWEGFTDAVIAAVSAATAPSVFMLWGAHAQKKAALVDESHHLVLTAAHPSPLSAHNGFHGCRHFSRANAFLSEHGRGTIDWALPPMAA